MKYGETTVCVMNQDFFKYIPFSIREQLRTLYDLHWTKEWFEDAWEEYRQYVLDCVAKKENLYDLPGPRAFNKYLKKEFEENCKKSGIPKALGGGLYECMNCGRSFLADHLEGLNCPSCGIEFKKIPQEGPGTNRR